MRHQKAGRKLGRNASHRLALKRNLTRSLIEHGRIVTTVQKYTEPLEPFIEKFDTPVPILSAFDSSETFGDLLLKGSGISQDQQDRFNLMVRIIKAVNTIDRSPNPHL